MSHRIHPNPFPAMLNRTDEEDSSGSMRTAMKFLEGIDQEDESLRLRRRAERTSAATVSCMVARAVVCR